MRTSPLLNRKQLFGRERRDSKVIYFALDWHRLRLDIGAWLVISERRGYGNWEVRGGSGPSSFQVLPPQLLVKDNLYIQTIPREEFPG